MNYSYPFIEDINSVLERMCGNEALLKRLLNKFRDTYADSRSKLLALLNTSENEEAYRLVHSIKGVSANLGIGKLYRLSTRLENRMKANEFDAIQADTESFLLELETVIGDLA